MEDVIVIGGGPAGNMAAIGLVELGHRVVVIDSRHCLGDKLCTGIIGKECFDRFPPDEDDILGKAQSATFVSPLGKTHRVTKKKPQAYIVDRISFVASLAERASDGGAVYRLGEQVVGISRNSQSIEVETVSGSSHHKYESKVVVIGSGFGSPLLPMVGLTSGGSNGHMVASQAVVESSNLTETEIYLGRNVAPGSFGWLVPIDESIALTGMVTRQKLNGHMDNFIDSLSEDGKVKSVIDEPKKWGIPVKPLPRTYSDGVVVVGDAAGLVKPTTGGGIYYALLSGEIAATTVHAAFVNENFSAIQLSNYETEWKRLFGNELRVGYYARMIYETLGDSQIESLLDTVLETDLKNDILNNDEFSFDWHSGVIRFAMNRNVLGTLLRSFGPMVGSIVTKVSQLRV